MTISCTCCGQHDIWVYPYRLCHFIPRLGGMLTLMSFVEAIGTLMADPGLEVILQSAFGGVPKMLSGKNFPQNVRALHLVTGELLQGLLTDMDTSEELMSALETRAAQSKTNKMWIDNLIKPVMIMMMFIRAEREGD